MAAFTKLHSVYGRVLGISSTRGIVQAVGSTGGASTAFIMAAQMWGDAMTVAVTSTIASTLTNFGFTSVSSGTSTALTGFEIAAPVVGVSKEIYIDTSASEATFGGTSTAIVFTSVAQGAGSSMFFSAINLAGVGFRMTGISTARWAVAASTASLTIG